MKAKFSFFIFFFIICASLVYSQEYKILSSTASSIIVEYHPIYTDTTSKSYEGYKFISTGLFNATYSNKIKPGSPLIPFKIFNVGVPQESGNTIQVIQSQYVTIKGKPLPQITVGYSNGEKIQKYTADEDLYSQFTNDDLVTFDEFGLVRELQVQSIKVSPIQYSPADQSIKFYTKIIFQVNFSSSKAGTAVISDNFMNNVVLNFDVARNWGIPQNKLSKISSTSSVLASGSWVRFPISDEGIYKIDYTTLKNLGFNPDTIDPSTIKIYNNGGYQLPEKVSASRPVDLVENAIYVSGQSDGKFDTGDYILFYGRGVNFWESVTNKSVNNYGDTISVSKVTRIKHPFAKTNYYWITAGGNAGKRMNSITPVTTTAIFDQQTTNAYTYKEDDTVKIEETGRLYLGDKFNINTKSRTYTTTLNGVVPNSTINYNFSLANVNFSSDASLSRSISYQFYESNNLILSNQIYFWFDVYCFGTLDNKTAAFSGTLNNEQSVLKLYFDGIDNPYKTAYLDFFEIQYQRYLKAVSDNITFFSKDTTGVVQFDLSNFSNSYIQAFDVSDYANVKLISLAQNVNISGGNCTFKIQETGGKIAKYIAIDNLAYKSIPSTKETIEVQDYRGEKTGYEYVIIAPAALSNDAATLANYRANSSPNKHSSGVFLLEKIYNEFSGGTQDPTAIRDFLKYAYTNWTTKPVYVLLFGDGTYDYYGISTNGAAKNLIPTMQTVESLHEIDSYPYEDYYARIVGDDKKVDLAIGRINVHNSDEAKAVIDKIEKYENLDETDKNWRNLISLVADDEYPLSKNDGSLHTDQSEQIANYYIPKTFNLNKIYLAAYPTIISSAGRRKPEVNQAILDAMSNGTLILSFIGHGAPNIWADEYVLETSSSNYFKNDKYYFLTAATCDFGKFDAASLECGAEKMLITPGTGSIGGLAAARLTYPTYNFELNSFFYYTLLFSKDSQGKPISIGDAYFLTKQHGSSNISNDEKFVLFGDPALKLKIPQLPVTIDSINSRAASVSTQIKALDHVKLKGSVLNLDNSKSSFNGEALVSIFDSQKQVDIPGQNNDGVDFNITYQGGLIYRGKVTVTNGSYSTEFIVPKDISYENKNGKIVTYCYNSSSDGFGYSGNIIVGGTNTSAVNDGKGPTIELFFDNFSSKDSYLVSPNFTLLLKLSDETGLNTTGVGIGHKLECVINDDESNPIDLTNYFVGDLDSGGKSGTVSYSFSGYSPGEYKIKIKAWDVFNNSSVLESYFTVVESGNLVIKNVVNYPNPFSSKTTFTFQHNLSKAINAKIKIYTVAGRLIKKLEISNIIDKFVRIDWDGRDEDGNSIANGTYLYKLIVETVDNEYSQDVLGKLSIVR